MPLQRERDRTTQRRGESLLAYVKGVDPPLALHWQRLLIDGANCLHTDDVVRGHSTTDVGHGVHIFHYTTIAVLVRLCCPHLVRHVAIISRYLLSRYLLIYAC